MVELEGPNFLHFSVRDSGIGIPEKNIQPLFNEFYQVDIIEEKYRQISGTGLGLSISKKL